MRNRSLVKQTKTIEKTLTPLWNEVSGVPVSLLARDDDETQTTKKPPQSFEFDVVDAFNDVIGARTRRFVSSSYSFRRLAMNVRFYRLRLGSLWHKRLSWPVWIFRFVVVRRRSSSNRVESTRVTHVKGARFLWQA